MRRCLLVLLPVAVAAVMGCGSGEEKSSATQTPATKVTAQPETTATAAVAPDTLTRSQPVRRPSPPPPTVQIDDQGRFTVQVSSWRTRGKAEAQAGILRQTGYDAYVQKAVLDNGETWYRVRVGAFATIEEAQRFAATLSDVLESGYWVDRMQNEG